MLTISDTRTNQNNNSYLPLSELPKVHPEYGFECLIKNWNEFKHKKLVEGKHIVNKDRKFGGLDEFCNGVWDNVYCWPPSKYGTVLTRLCSEVFQNKYPQYTAKLTGEVTRVCLTNGSWSPDSYHVYTECVKSLELYRIETEEDEMLASVVSSMLFYGSLLSLFCLSASLTIFYFYRVLRCDLVTVQIQLILSLLLRCILMFVIGEPFVLGQPSSFRDLDILCEAVLVLHLYLTFVSVTWMFLQGLHLNVTLMSPSDNANSESSIKIYYIIGWVVPAVFVIIYVMAMLLKQQERCWHGYLKMKEIWILIGPIILQHCVNGLFLLNVLRIFLRKIRSSNTRPDASQIKATAKATAILFPVLGISNLLFFYNPGGKYYKYFLMLNTFCGSTQGVFVAIVYCFANKDVLAAIRRSVERANAGRIDARNEVMGMVALNVPRCNNH